MSWINIKINFLQNYTAKYAKQITYFQIHLNKLMTSIARFLEEVFVIGYDLTIVPEEPVMILYDEAVKII